MVQLFFHVTFHAFSRIKAKQTLKKKKLEKQTDEGADDRTSKQNGKDKDVQHGNRDSYCSSTDIDSEGEAKSRLEDWSEKQKHERSRDSLPPLPDFLQGKTFLLSEDLTETEVQSLTRYVTAFGGLVELAMFSLCFYFLTLLPY